MNVVKIKRISNRVVITFDKKNYFRLCLTMRKSEVL